MLKTTVYRDRVKGLACPSRYTILVFASAAFRPQKPHTSMLGDAKNNNFGQPARRFWFVVCGLRVLLSFAINFRSTAVCIPDEAAPASEPVARKGPGRLLVVASSDIFADPWLDKASSSLARVAAEI